MKGSLITCPPMTLNSLWVTLPNILRKAVWSHLSYDQQLVSNIAHFVNCSSITCSPMTNTSEWVILYILWKQPHHDHYDQQLVSDIACMHSSHIFFYDQQRVSDIGHLWNHVLIQPTGSEWHCKFYERQYHHICSYELQAVSDIVNIATWILRIWMFSILWILESEHLARSFTFNIIIVIDCKSLPTVTSSVYYIMSLVFRCVIPIHEELVFIFSL